MSFFTHGHSVLLSEKLLSSWDRCVVLPSVSISGCLQREKAPTYHCPDPGVTCPREEQRPGPCSEAETPSTVLMTKISQEGETSPGAAPKRHLNDAYTQDLSAKTDGHFISPTHWQFCNGQVIKTACGHTVCFLSSLAGKAMSMGHTSIAFSSSF